MEAAVRRRFVPTSVIFCLVQSVTGVWDVAKNIATARRRIAPSLVIFCLVQGVAGVWGFAKSVAIARNHVLPALVIFCLVQSVAEVVGAHGELPSRKSFASRLGHFLPCAKCGWGRGSL